MAFTNILGIINHNGNRYVIIDCTQPADFPVSYTHLADEKTAFESVPYAVIDGEKRIMRSFADEKTMYTPVSYTHLIFMITKWISLL